MALIYNYVKDFFGFVFEALKTLVGFFGSILSVIGTCLIFLKDVFTALPAIFWIPFVGLIAICVIYKILGREGQD